MKTTYIVPILAMASALIATTSGRAQSPPPIPPSTNSMMYWETNVCGPTGTIEQTWTGTEFVQVSTNGIPWQGYPSNVNILPTFTQCNDESNILHIEWSWGNASKRVFSTNVNLATATFNFFGQYIWTPYYIPGTNEVVQYISYKTDGNTLSFAHNLTGPWTWSGANNYREPVSLLSYRFVQGVSTTGSVNPVHLWATNEFWMGGVCIKRELTQ